MKIRELIDKLSAFDQDIEVVYRHKDEYSLRDGVYTLADVIECKSPDGISFAEITDYFV